MMKNDIEIRNLTKRFEDKIAVEDLSLSVKKGELFGFLGPNGAGKTVTIKCLCGLVETTSGDVKIGGYDTRKEIEKIHKIIGLCPQEPAFYGYLTGRENIELFGRLGGMPETELKERTDHLIKSVGLGEDANRRASKYSGGMIRRINLAMALINDPQIAFLDEPTVAMDPQSRHATWDLINDLKNSGKTVVLTSHYIEEVEALADRVGIIDHGRLIALDTPKALMHKYSASNLEDVFITITGRRIREGD